MRGVIARLLLPLATVVLSGASVAPPAPAALRSPAETVEVLWSTGQVRYRYDVDDEGRKHGVYQEFAQDGTQLLRARYKADALDGPYASFHASGERFVSAKYRAGELDGKYTEYDERGETAVKASYKRGLLDGKRTFYVEGKIDGEQKWKQGELQELDGFAPYPRPLAEIAAEQLAFRAQTPPRVELGEDNEDEFLRVERERGLVRLKEYRALMGLRWDDLELDPDMDFHAQWGARLCAAIDRLDHTPANPGWPDDDYRKGYEGTSHSNLATVDDAARSIDMYMDDSDPSNIDRIGHRMHCIAGALKKTGFGCFSGYSAMWSMDRGGKPNKLDVAAYPPAGFVPVDRFGGRIAWSLSFDPGFRRVPDVEELKIEVVRLDDRYRPDGAALALDHLARLDGRTLVFRPVGVVVTPGARYRLRIDGLDGGKRGEPYQALVEFVKLAE